MSSRARKLWVLARVVVAVLLLKVLLAILVEYRWYFPANFDSAFLTGRRESFQGLYAGAFYAHIVSGPLTILLGAFLMSRALHNRFHSLHRWAGRGQALLIFAVLVPSGLVMATEAFAGPVAGYGFAALAIATAASMAMAVRHACARRIALHRRWASRCFVLLISPLLLRLVSGVLIVMQWESEWAYRLNAWCSWLVPLIVFEVWWRCTSGELFAARESALLRSPIPHPSPFAKEAVP
jgi:hypothetical protein